MSVRLKTSDDYWTLQSRNIKWTQFPIFPAKRAVITNLSLLLINGDWSSLFSEVLFLSSSSYYCHNHVKLQHDNIKRDKKLLYWINSPSTLRDVTISHGRTTFLNPLFAATCSIKEGFHLLHEEDKQEVLEVVDFSKNDPATDFWFLPMWDKSAKWPDSFLESRCFLYFRGSQLVESQHFFSLSNRPNSNSFHTTQITF